MEGHEELNDLEELKLAVSGLPESIEREYSKGVNNWPACVLGNLLNVEVYLSMAEDSGLIDSDKAKIIHEKLFSLKARLLDLQKQYPEYTDEVPPEIKEEILSQLNILE